jgi:hypothetical protein
MLVRKTSWKNSSLEDQEGHGNSALRGILEKQLVRAGGVWN